jgi:hypothetical protein
VTDTPAPTEPPLPAGETEPAQETPVPADPPEPAEAEAEVLAQEAILSVTQAEAGCIVLEGGEIVRPEYLSSCRVKGLEPVGIIFLMDKTRKMMIGMDAFYGYGQEKGYDWGKVYSKNTDMSKLHIQMPRAKGAKMTLTVYSSERKPYSEGNNSLLLDKLSTWSSRDLNVYANYIQPYGKTHRCGLEGITWEAPSTYEIQELYKSRSAIQAAKDAVASYLRTMGDSRAALLDSSRGLIPSEKYILTSNSGTGSWDDKGKIGIWAFREIAEWSTKAGDQSIIMIIDPDSKPIFSYQYFVKDQESGTDSRLEFVLARNNHCVFGAMAVARLQ